MNITSYQIISLLGNFIMAYILQKYMGIFYTAKKANATLEMLAYISYAILISIIYFAIKIPMVLIFTNLICIFLFTRLYEGSIRKSLLVVVFVYISMMLIETLVVFLTSQLKISLLQEFPYESEFGVILARIACYIFVLLMHSFKNIKGEIPIPTVYWFALLILPVCTLILLFSVFMGSLDSRILTILSMCSVLLINIFAFYLYDRMSALMLTQINQKVELEKQQFYKYQVQMMKNSLNEMREIRHDIRNKISPLYGLANNHDMESLQEQLSELMELCSSTKTYATSGNTAIDSVINYKLQYADKQNIHTNIEILIPCDFDVPAFDIAAIIGNLLDNALEATEQVEDRWIHMQMKYLKGCLTIDISNSFNGTVLYQNDKLHTLKSNKEEHGLGIQSIKRILHKYDGTIQINSENEVFNVKILMYL